MIRHQLSINKHSKHDLQELYDLIKNGEEYAEVFICDRKVTRSARQRKYYYAVVCKIVADSCGYTKDEANEVLKLTFNPRTVKLTNGEYKTYGHSIETERVSRCEEIFEEIRRNFAEMGIDIPEPEKIPPSYYVKCAIKG